MQPAQQASTVICAPLLHTVALLYCNLRSTATYCGTAILQSALHCYILWHCYISPSSSSLDTIMETIHRQLMPGILDAMNRQTHSSVLLYFILFKIGPYVYWTMHHLDSWIKIDQVMSLVLFLLNMFQMLVHSSSGACDCVWVYCSGLMCVGIMVWFGWGGVVSLCRLRH
jgi:hypothetical protein